jgi:hypothetical protein
LNVRLSFATRGGRDTIVAYTEYLAEALAAAGVAVDVLDVAADPGGGAVDWLILQYNPYSFARWGVAPRLPARIRDLRRRSQTTRVAVMVHEVAAPPGRPDRRVLAAAHRAQLRALLRDADLLIAPVESWIATLGGRPALHLPVPSVLPAARSDRDASRARLGIRDEELVVAALARSHPLRDAEALDAGLQAAAHTGKRVTFLNLGPGVAPLRAAGVREIRPGWLEAGVLARELAAADLLLAPTRDGVSGRRTSTMAGLQHEIAVVATDGPLTDRFWREAPAPVALARAGDPAAYAAVVGRLADDSAERSAVAAAGRRLYESALAWPVLAQRLLRALSGERVRSVGGE